MENNKVSVRIMGQEYVLSGDKRPEDIKKIADYVDEKMRLVGKVMHDGNSTKAAILAAVNVTEEYFDSLEEIKLLQSAKEQVETDSKHYLVMWEEAKKSFIQYKENALKVQEEKKEADDKYAELEAKCNEFENSFFDIQMENIKLKSEVDKLFREKEEAKKDDF